MHSFIVGLITCFDETRKINADLLFFMSNMKVYFAAKIHKTLESTFNTCINNAQICAVGFC